MPTSLMGLSFVTIESLESRVHVAAYYPQYFIIICAVWNEMEGLIGVYHRQNHRKKVSKSYLLTFVGFPTGRDLRAFEQRYL